MQMAAPSEAHDPGRWTGARRVWRATGRLRSRKRLGRAGKLRADVNLNRGSCAAGPAAELLRSWGCGVVTATSEDIALAALSEGDHTAGTGPGFAGLLTVDLALPTPHRVGK
jgi:hypothetical protein